MICIGLKSNIQASLFRLCLARLTPDEKWLAMAIEAEDNSFVRTVEVAGVPAVALPAHITSEKLH